MSDHLFSDLLSSSPGSASRLWKNKHRYRYLLREMPQTWILQYPHFYVHGTGSPLQLFYNLYIWYPRGRIRRDALWSEEDNGIRSPLPSAPIPPAESGPD